MLKEEICEFIKRRFKADCDWKTGNCYYFSLILKDRFPQGDIYYDVIDGHFVLKLENKYYDWSGETVVECPIKWEDFDEYDIFQKERVIRDCLK